MFTIPLPVIKVEKFRNLIRLTKALKMVADKNTA